MAQMNEQPDDAPGRQKFMRLSSVYCSTFLRGLTIRTAASRSPIRRPHVFHWSDPAKENFRAMAEMLEPRCLLSVVFETDVNGTGTGAGNLVSLGGTATLLSSANITAY